MAGLAELRGDTTDTFWTWRETMYRFALAMTPDDVAAVATLLYVEMLEQGLPASANSIICIMIATVRAMPISPRWPRALRRLPKRPASR